MIRIVRSLFLTWLVALYGCFFVAQEQMTQKREASLAFALPATFHTIVASYLKELAAEMLFVKTSVFLGGLRPDTTPTSYVDALSNNFEVMTQLYPRFIDPYYFCQAFLTPISQAAATKASYIFETGITAYPNDFILRFFYSSNFFLAMNEPLKGAEAFTEAAKLPDAPQLFGHLAALLSAQGGDIAAGLISLKAMLASEKDEVVRTRYEEEAATFEKALEVQKALNAYTTKYGSAPGTLELLVPEFIVSIPEIKDSFILVYNSPNLHLQRPDRKKS